MDGWGGKLGEEGGVVLARVEADGDDGAFAAGGVVAVRVGVSVWISRGDAEVEGMFMR